MDVEIASAISNPLKYGVFERRRSKIQTIFIIYLEGTNFHVIFERYF